MDQVNVTEVLTTERIQKMIQFIDALPSRELRPRPTRRKRSPSPETDRPLRNLRVRLTRPKYTQSDLEDSDSDLSGDAPSTATQSDKNFTNNPAVISDTGSPDIGPSPLSQTNGNTPTSDTDTPDITPSPTSQTNETTITEPLTPTSPTSPFGELTMPPQIKTSTWELGTDPGTEVDCAILALEAEMRSNTAKIACLKARKVTDEAQKIAAELAAELAAGVSDIKDCEEAVTAAVVDRDLHEVLDVRIMELMKNTGKLFEMLVKMREVKGLIGGKDERRTKVPDGEGKANLVEENDVDGEENGGRSVATDDKDGWEVGEISLAGDDTNNDEDGNMRVNDTKDEVDDDDDDEDSDSDESSGDEFDGFIVDDTDDDGDNDEDTDDDYHEDTDDDILDIRTPYVDYIEEF
ncbi:hypothetical protein V490_07354 [Pseudogymnoascus sp. VKM F-3557]|nr:hypothetical protein V490_07354 [Pseudogymnoascus sp. VKM F-3557]